MIRLTFYEMVANIMSKQYYTLKEFERVERPKTSPFQLGWVNGNLNKGRRAPTHTFKDAIDWTISPEKETL